MRWAIAQAVPVARFFTLLGVEARTRSVLLYAIDPFLPRPQQKSPRISATTTHFGVGMYREGANAELTAQPATTDQTKATQGSTSHPPATAPRDSLAARRDACCCMYFVSEGGLAPLPHVPSHPGPTRRHSTDLGPSKRSRRPAHAVSAAPCRRPETGLGLNRPPRRPRRGGLCVASGSRSPTASPPRLCIRTRHSLRP